MKSGFKLTLLAAGAAIVAGPATAQTVGFATLPPGAINNITVQVLSKVVQSKSDLKVRVSPLRGGAAIMSAVDKKRAEFGIGEVASLTVGLEGEAEFKGRPTKNLRVVLRLRNLTVGLFVLKDSPIKNIADVRGKRFPTKWSSFPNAVTLLTGIFATAGLTFDDVKGVPVTNIIRGANDFKAGKLDVGFFATGAPKVAEVNSAVGGVRFLSIPKTAENLKKIQAVRPDYFIATVKPSPINAGIAKPTNVLGVDTIVFAGTHVSNETVEKFVAAVQPNKADLVKGHPLFRAFVPKLMAKQFKIARYHPGAIAFYKKKGMWPGS